MGKYRARARVRILLKIQENLQFQFKTILVLMFTLSLFELFIKHPFELESVMNYCSKCGSRDGLTVMTTLNGETWTSSFIEKVTTTDYLQIHYAYCKDNSIFSDGKIFEEKDTVKCTSTDTVVPNFNRPIFTDRICDGKVKFMKSTRQKFKRDKIGRLCRHGR